MIFASFIQERIYRAGGTLFLLYHRTKIQQIRIHMYTTSFSHKKIVSKQGHDVKNALSLVQALAP